MRQIRQFVHNAFRWLGWDVRRSIYPTSEEILLATFLRLVKPDVVLDVGANIGQYATQLRKCGFEGDIVSFEALPDAHTTLKEIAAADPNWIVAPRRALGRVAGISEIHVARNSLSSSLLPMGARHLSAAPDSRYVSSLSVEVARLDELSEPFIGGHGRVFLKIDTQGYEEEVLLGSEGVLPRVCAMQLELSVTPLYVGAPSFRRMLEVCEGFGFELYGFMPGFFDRSTGRLLQVDGLFLRVNGNV